MFVTKPRLFFAYALENRFAVPSFNVCNLEIARGVIEAAEAERAPVMIQAYFGDLHHGGLDVLPQIFRLLAEQARVPVLVHQDHPGDDQMILECLRRGFRSVMHDGGHLPLEENIRGAARIVEVAHPFGASVEAELGQFGDEGHGIHAQKTFAAETRRMVEESGIDTLAVSVGSVHGQSSRLDLRLLEEIANLTPAPLVLHGGSGIHPDDVREAVNMNVVKVNIGDAIVKAWLSGLQEGPTVASGHEPKHHVVMRHATGKVRDAASARLSVMGASNHAEPLLHRLEKEKTDLSEIRATPISLPQNIAGAPAGKMSLEQALKSSQTSAERAMNEAGYTK